jgi:hypothetical protein
MACITYLEKSAYLHARAWRALLLACTSMVCITYLAKSAYLHARAWRALLLACTSMECITNLKKISLLACTSMALVAYFETFYFTNPYLAFFFESHVRHDTCMIHVRHDTCMIHVWHDTCMIHVRHDTCMIHARLTAKAPIGELIYTAINSVPQICYVLSVLTRYMTAWMASPAGPAQRQHGA